MLQNMRSRGTSTTITDLKKRLGSDIPTKKDRERYLSTFIQGLEDEHMGYFNGKKVPFRKNTAYRQCVFNPFKEDGSVITL